MSLQDDGMKMVDGIRSRLGFRSKKQDDAYDEYEENYDEYGENYNDDYDEYGDYADSGYGETDSSYDRFTPASAGSAQGYADASSRSPRLVSLQDVRENTVLPSDTYYSESSSRYTSSVAASDTFSSDPSENPLFDPSLSPQMSSESISETSVSVSQQNSSGLDSLFSPTIDSDEYPDGATAINDYRTAYTNSGNSNVADPEAMNTFEPQRTITVLKLVSYSEAEYVAKALQRGDLVILCLRNLSDNLFSRILDFSFGAACALNASVECVGEKTFAISNTGALSNEERIALREQGVLQ